jgi:hypothetical protein
MSDGKYEVKLSEQSEKFLEAARALETDEDEAAFDRNLKRVAQSAPEKND